MRAVRRCGRSALSVSLTGLTADTGLGAVTDGGLDAAAADWVGAAAGGSTGQKHCTDASHDDRGRSSVVPYARTVRTASDATAVQAVYSSQRGSREIEPLGPAHDEAKPEALKAAAQQRLAAAQSVLDLGPCPRLRVPRSRPQSASGG